MTKALANYEVVGDGPRTLLFLHGLGGDQTNWAPQAEEFGRDFRCVAWTMPGFGTSPPLASMTWATLADAAAAVLDEVGADQATVVGLSMGGYVAQQFAVRHADRVDRVVLAATTARFGRGDQGFAAKFLASRLKPIEEGKTPADLAPNIVRGLFSEDAPSAMTSIAIESMSRISPDGYRQALGCLVTWDFRSQLANLVQPTLCLAGADDRTAPVAAVQALADALPHARLETIEACNHLMNLDRPRAFNSMLRAFLHQ